MFGNFFKPDPNVPSNEAPLSEKGAYVIKHEVTREAKYIVSRALFYIFFLIPLTFIIAMMYRLKEGFQPNDGFNVEGFSIKSVVGEKGGIGFCEV